MILEWTVNGVVEDIAKNIFKYLINMLRSEDVYLAFSRYRKYSIKSEINPISKRKEFDLTASGCFKVYFAF